MVMDNELILFEGKIPIRAFQFSEGIIDSINPKRAVDSVIDRFDWTVKITTQRLILVKGIISQKHEQIEYYRVKDVTYEQTIAARMVNVGMIHIVSNDASTPQISFPFINPKKYVDLIREHVNIMRRQAGSVYMET